MRRFKITLLLVLTGIYFSACSNNSNHDHSHGESSSHNHDAHGHDHGDEHHDEVHLTQEQHESLGIEVKTLTTRNLSSYVEANGQLEVAPQSQATVTAIIGANVTSIKVIEGQKVEKGQILAYLSHPDLIELQSNYTAEWHQLQYLEQEYVRQKKLYDEKVGSGKEFQKTQAEFFAAKGRVKGYEAKLKLMGLNTERILVSEFYEQVPLYSPLDGYIRLVEVNTGQYVQPQTEVFEIVNTHHIHADLMVFEKDMYAVKEGQTVSLSLESLPELRLEASIYSVGKSFEENPKAIHIHAEIEDKESHLIPGTYVRGRIMVNNSETLAIPIDGVIREGDKTYIFTAHKEGDLWVFTPTEVSLGAEDGEWVEIKTTRHLNEKSHVAWNNAYYLMAELKKAEAEHSH